MAARSYAFVVATHLPDSVKTHFFGSAYADHWNSIHPNEEPIQIPMDLTDYIEWRKNAPDESPKAS